MKITIIIEEVVNKHTPPNKGKKLEEMYDPEKVKKIRRRIHRSQLRRWARNGK